MSAKLNYLILGISLAVGVVLRTFMLLFTVETNSGFIKQAYITPALLIIVFIVIAAALVFVTSLNHKKRILKQETIPLAKAITGLLLAVAIFYEAFLSNLLEYATPTQSLFHRVSAILSVAAFIYIAVCYFTKKEYPKIIAAVPILFWITRVITVFTEFATLATVSDTVIETATMCLCLFVFLNSAKVECKIEIKRMNLARAVAALCGYVGLVSSLPRIICAVITPEAFGYFSNIPPFTSLAAALFAINFALQIEE